MLKYVIEEHCHLVSVVTINSIMIRKNVVSNNGLFFIGILSFVLFIIYFEMQVLHLEGNNEKISKHLLIMYGK